MSRHRFSGVEGFSQQNLHQVEIDVAPGARDVAEKIENEGAQGRDK